MTYASVVGADTPFLWWRLGESSGPTAVDASGNSRDGTYSGPPTLGATGLLVGDANTAMATDGVGNQYVSRADTTDLTAFSVEAWVAQGATNSGVRFVAGREDGTFTVFRLSLDNRLPTITIWNGVTNTSVIGVVALTAGTVHHLVGTYDGTTLRLYVDGTLVGTSTAISGALSTANADFTVGSRPGGGLRFHGTIDEPAYYTTALSPARVTAHYAAGLGLSGLPRIVQQKWFQSGGATNFGLVLDNDPVPGNLLVAVGMINGSLNSPVHPWGATPDVIVGSGAVPTAHAYHKVAQSGESKTIAFSVSVARSGAFGVVEVEPTPGKAWGSLDSFATAGSSGASLPMGPTGALADVDDFAITATTITATPGGVPAHDNGFTQFTGPDTTSRGFAAFKVLTSAAPVSVTSSWVSIRTANGLIAVYKQAPLATTAVGFLGLL